MKYVDWKLLFPNDYIFTNVAELDITNAGPCGMQSNTNESTYLIGSTMPLVTFF